MHSYELLNIFKWSFSVVIYVNKLPKLSIIKLMLQLTLKWQQLLVIMD